MTEEEFNQHSADAINSIFNVVANSGNTLILEKILLMVVSLSIAILRGLLGHEWVEDFLSAAIEDKENVITVEKLKIH